MRYSPSICLILAFSALSVACGDDDAKERLAEKARIEGRETAKTELQVQLDNLARKIEIARAEGKATAQAELQTQIENIDLISQKSKAEGRAIALAELQTQIENLEMIAQKAKAEGRAAAQAELQAQIENIGLIIEKAKEEGRAQAEAEISANNSNLAAKAAKMEADLATRHLFFQAVKGTYEGTFSTEKGLFKVRITLVPSLPPYIVDRTRQLEEVSEDLRRLTFHAQILQWNPNNRLSSVGCRIENIRPDLVKGQIDIASESCPNLYKLNIVDIASSNTALNDESTELSIFEAAAATASAIREGKIRELPEIRGEIHPTTNASIYKLSVKRASSR